ncbi:MAG: hypothetical protein R3281_16910 [Balneolaceae bacterium]|nr:hypothetical protein [Balneolaceae bacterium]
MQEIPAVVNYAPEKGAVELLEIPVPDIREREVLLEVAKVGWGREPLGFSLDPLVQKNVTLQGSFSHNWSIWERVIALMASGRLDVKPIIGGIWPIEEWHDAFEAMNEGSVVKSILTLG